MPLEVFQSAKFDEARQNFMNTVDQYRLEAEADMARINDQFKDLIKFAKHQRKEFKRERDAQQQVNE